MSNFERFLLTLKLRSLMYFSKKRLQKAIKLDNQIQRDNEQLRAILGLLTNTSETNNDK